METGLLEFQERCHGTGSKHHFRNEMVSEFRGQRLMRELVWVRAVPDQSFGLFPDRIMAAKKHRAAALQSGNRIVARRKSAFRILVVLWIGGSRFLFNDERVRREPRPSELREIIFIPHGLVVQGQMCRCMRGGDN